MSIINSIHNGHVLLIRHNRYISSRSMKLMILRTRVLPRRNSKYNSKVLYDRNNIFDRNILRFNSVLNFFISRISSEIFINQYKLHYYPLNCEPSSHRIKAFVKQSVLLHVQKSVKLKNAWIMWIVLKKDVHFTT